MEPKSPLKKEEEEARERPLNEESRFKVMAAMGNSEGKTRKLRKEMDMKK